MAKLKRYIPEEKVLILLEAVEDGKAVSTVWSIAEVYSNQSNYLRALDWFHKALVIREKALGK
jgi:hypothetical protein